ncbi:Hpt domain-containing protein [Alicyclobacillus cycloheptanicus]|uniref:histidine kinase n=1 Tax=Alicyclobacillus cycloheptanicus TaxID=1457 RepID=A0ABT9XJQ1_9BACL|nr:chemotaxis protein histidine kinase CheA [Alicyclobacillus cycloheptanicus]WDM01381.1 Hpt domain-containing protein [Alicyclobacillus cycloheptanicus]
MDVMEHELQTWRSSAATDIRVEAALRAAHTLKGNAAALELTALANLAHHIETALLAVQAGHRAPHGAWWMEMGEQVAALRALVAALCDAGPETAAVSGEEAVPLAAWLTPICQQFAKTAANTLGKPVEIEVRGEDVSLPAAWMASLSAAIVQLLRNAVVHGIEPPAERRRRGKPEKGRVAVEVSVRGGCVVIDVSDDGRGIDAQRVAEQAVRLGAAADADGASTEDVFDLLFRPGLSTAGQVTEWAGRGVGLDVVQSWAASVGGRVRVLHSGAQGTAFRLCIPTAQPAKPVEDGRPADGCEEDARKENGRSR